MVLPSTTSQSIQQLRSTSATNGLSEILVLDNGTALAFTSTEFQEFVSHDGICHITSAPYHLALTGLAERAVQSLKQRSRKNTSADDMETRIPKFLF